MSEASEKLANLERQSHALEVILSSHLAQQAHCDLLEESYASLEKLNQLGSADFCRDAIGHDLEQQLQHIRSFIAEFSKNTLALKHARSEFQGKIKIEQDDVRSLIRNLQALHKENGSQENAPNVIQKVRDMPYRILPWTTQGLDELRFRKMLVILLLPAILFGAAVPYFKPPVEKSMDVVVPQRIAKLINKNQEIKQVELKPQEPEVKKVSKLTKKVTKVDEESAEVQVQIKLPQSTETEAESSRRSAEARGVLAFKNDLANLLDDSSVPKSNSEVLAAVKGEISSDDSSRSIIVSRASGVGESGSSSLVLSSGRGSGGLKTSGINLNVGVVGRGQSIAETGIKISRVDSTAISGASDQSLSKVRGPTRTDSEIQVVFDRYKSELYRVYNRELRVSPGLRGKMILRIVIEPDGSVSECTLKSNDFESTTFASNIVKRVLSFNFGAKDDVSVITILYPIEYLPPN